MRKRLLELGKCIIKDRQGVRGHGKGNNFSYWGQRENLLNLVMPVLNILGVGGVGISVSGETG